MSARTPCGSACWRPCAARRLPAGPPGIAKSLIARRLRLAFHDARHFEYLMTRFQYAGGGVRPLSIQALKGGRQVSGSPPATCRRPGGLPRRIWKAGPPSSTPCSPPSTSGSFATATASTPSPCGCWSPPPTRLPAPDSGLEALYDRMLVRVWMDRVQEKSRTSGHAGERWPVPQNLAPRCRSGEEYAAWQDAIEQVRLPDACFELIYQLRQQLDSQLGHGCYVSDRRWKKAVRAHQGERLLQRPRRGGPAGSAAVQDCLWHDEASRTRAAGDDRRIFPPLRLPAAGADPATAGPARAVPAVEGPSPNASATRRSSASSGSVAAPAAPRLPLANARAFGKQVHFHLLTRRPWTAAIPTA